jgi:hypothetical protein
MKTLKTIFTSLAIVLLFSVSAMAQSGAEVYGVINRADWCPVCENNGERAMKVFKMNNKDGAIKFVINDLTNDQTKEKSATKLKKYNLYEKMKPYNSTGVVFFFNSKTDELIDKISVKKSNEKLKKAIVSAKKDA